MDTSFKKINYSLRPKKNVERKMIVDCLAAIGQKKPISEYRYVGFGSMWFTDFILMHKALGVTDMVSIENAESGEKRARFNRPFDCVEVVFGDAINVLPDLNWEDIPSVVWLDYDKGLNHGLLDDLDVLGKHIAKSGSVVIVTANAHVSQLSRPKSRSGKKLTKAEVFEDLTNGILSDDLGQDAFEVENFPEPLSQALFARLDSAVRKGGKGLKFRPLFNFFYKDGAPMITVGGMAVDEEDGVQLDEMKLSQKNCFLKGKELISIDIPHLTPKEKFKLDEFVPNGPVPTCEDLGFDLDESEIKGYLQFYRYYPLFGEIMA